MRLRIADIQTDVSKLTMYHQDIRDGLDTVSREQP